MVVAMKYGMAIVWDGPANEDGLDKAYASAVLEAVQGKLIALNAAFAAQGARTLAFTVIPGTAEKLNPTGEKPAAG